MPFPSRPGRQEVLYLFHRWESISVRGPPLRLDTKPFCVHQGDAPIQWCGSSVPAMAWVRPPSREAISRLPRVPWRGAQVEDPGNVRCLPYIYIWTIFCFCSPYGSWLGWERLSSTPRTLTALGLKRSIKKSVWEPTQQLQHLGLLVDFQRGLDLLGTADSAVKSIQQQAKQLLISATDTTARVAVRTIDSFRRQGGVSGLGMSAGAVPDTGGARLHCRGATLGGARAVVSSSEHGPRLVGPLRCADAGAGHLAGPVHSGPARRCLGRDRLGSGFGPHGAGFGIMAKSSASRALTLPSRS